VSPFASVVTVASVDAGPDPVAEGEDPLDDDPVHAASATSAPAISRAVVTRAQLALIANGPLISPPAYALAYVAPHQT
jgi:hypothetical protein